MKRYTLIDLVTDQKVTIPEAISEEHAIEQARAIGYEMMFYTIEQTVPTQNRWNENRGII